MINFLGAEAAKVSDTFKSIKSRYPYLQIFAFSVFAASTFTANPARAAIKTVYSFEAPLGAVPMSGLTIGSDGNFYGTTSEGGPQDKGTIFRVTPGGQLTVLHAFQGTDGASPQSGLTLGNDGQLYGSTSAGGADGYGVIFRISTGGVFTLLHSLIDGPAGVVPLGALAQGSDGNFYGTTSTGGSSGGGGIFSVTPSGNFQTLRTLQLGDGINPQAGLLRASDGNFYGTTSRGGGASPGGGTGTVFKLTPSGDFSVLLVFNDSNCVDASAPLIEGSDGNLYGTCLNGGASNSGTLFKITKAGVLTVLHTFDNVTGAYPAAALIEGESGMFYGTTAAGGDGSSPSDPNPGQYRGTVFKVTSAGQFTVLHDLTSADGANSRSALIRAADGNFYGTTSSSGQAGTIFRISSAGTFATIADFGFLAGNDPSGTLVEDADGNLVGTARAGGSGTADAGTAFKLTTKGELSVLRSFAGNDGGAPLGGVIPAPDGSYYGTTFRGGTYGYGTVFRLGASGDLTVLHAFHNADGATPISRLTLGPDGALYGVTQDGGTGYGTVFRITLGGAFTSLHAFDASDGATPSGSLAVGSDGLLYGATYSGGAGYGTLYKISPSGVFTSLYAFAEDTPNHFPNAANPLSGLTAAPDGNFYGTTDRNTIFRLTPTGDVVTVYRLAESEGAGLDAPLVVGSDGNFYGTASSGGPAHPGTLDRYGTVFRMTVDGTLTVIHAFSGDDGQSPESGLLQASNGTLYGMTARGGRGGGGTVFEIAGPPLIPTGVTATPSDGSVSLGWNSAGGAESYSVYLRTPDQNTYGTPVLAGVTGSSAKIQGLNNGTTYSFEIVALNAVGQSLPSSEVSATPVQSTANNTVAGDNGGTMSPFTCALLALLGLTRRRRSIRRTE